MPQIIIAVHGLQSENTNKQTQPVNRNKCV